MMPNLESAIVPKDHNAPPANGPLLEFLRPSLDYLRLSRPWYAPTSAYAYFLEQYELCATGEILIRLPADEARPFASEMDDDHEAWVKLLRLRASIVGLMLVDPTNIWSDPAGTQRAGLLAIRARGRHKLNERVAVPQEDHRAIIDECRAEHGDAVDAIGLPVWSQEVRRRLDARTPLRKASEVVLIMAPVDQRDAWRAALVERTDATVSDLYEITPTGLVKFGAEDLHK